MLGCVLRIYLAVTLLVDTVTEICTSSAYVLACILASHASTCGVLVIAVTDAALSAAFRLSGGRIRLERLWTLLEQELRCALLELVGSPRQNRASVVPAGAVGRHRWG